MGVFKRFRDAATGLFTSKADAEARPANTDSETVDRLKMGERRKLREALEKAKLSPSVQMAYVNLRLAVEEVLDGR